VVEAYEGGQQQQPAQHDKIVGWGRTSESRNDDPLDKVLLALALGQAFDKLPGLAKVDAGEGVNLDVDLAVGRQLGRREAEEAVDEPGARHRARVERERPEDLGHKVGRQRGLRQALDGVLSRVFEMGQASAGRSVRSRDTSPDRTSYRRPSRSQ